MKTIKIFIATLLLTVVAIQLVSAQSVDSKGHRIDVSGKVTNSEGKHIGSVTKEGIISDHMGMNVAYIDGNGQLIDSKTGKSLGKVGKNGDFVPFSKNIAWTTSSPENGVCLIKDENGNVKAVVHETYKHLGACAIHCLTNNMKHGEVLDESKKVSFSCSMHPDVTSDKEGKCNKCGMDLIKKSN